MIIKCINVYCTGLTCKQSMILGNISRHLLREKGSWLIKSYQTIVSVIWYVVMFFLDGFFPTKHLRGNRGVLLEVRMKFTFCKDYFYDKLKSNGRNFLLNSSVTLFSVSIGSLQDFQSIFSSIFKTDGLAKTSLNKQRIANQKCRWSNMQ